MMGDIAEGTTYTDCTARSRDGSHEHKCRLTDGHLPVFLLEGGIRGNGDHVCRCRSRFAVPHHFADPPARADYPREAGP